MNIHASRFAITFLTVAISVTSCVLPPPAPEDHTSNEPRTENTTNNPRTINSRASHDSETEQKARPTPISTPTESNNSDAVARSVFVNDFWKKRFTKCSDGLFYAEMINSNDSSRKGYLLVKGEPEKFIFEPVELSEADIKNGFTMAADIMVSPSFSRMYLNEEGWQPYQEGFLAYSALSFWGANAEAGIALQVNHNKKTGWG